MSSREPGTIGASRRTLAAFRRTLAAACGLAGLAVLATPAFGWAPLPVRALVHDIPSDVTVQAFVRPEDGRLRFLVRVPLEAMRDFEWPVRGPGYLDIPAAAPLLEDAVRLWIVDYVSFFEEGVRLDDPRILETRIDIPSDRSFASWERALENVRAPPLEGELQLPWQQALLDVLLEYPIASEESRFSIEPEFAHLGQRTVTVLRFIAPDGTERAFQYTGDPGIVRLDPRWIQAAFRFVKLGFEHILDGIDHILFLLCLVIPVRRFWALLPIITSFTIAHSITLIASATGLAPNALWFPPLIETLIALSIVYMALENIVGAGTHRRWMLAFGFGLVHGFGFSFVLRETLQFGGSHLFTSLLSFNVGVELGQILVVLVAIPVLEWLFRRVVAERMGVIILSAIVGHTAWHWMTARGAELFQYGFQWPAWNAEFAATLMRWAMLAVVIGGTVWLIRRPFARWLEHAAEAEAEGPRVLRESPPNA